MKGGLFQIHMILLIHINAVDTLEIWTHDIAMINLVCPRIKLGDLVTALKRPLDRLETA